MLCRYLQYYSNHEQKSKTKFISSDCLLIVSSISIYVNLILKNKKIAHVKILRFPSAYKLVIHQTPPSKWKHHLKRLKPRYVIQAFCALSFCIPFTSPLIRNTTVIVISFSNNKLNLSEVNFIISPWDIGSPPFYNWWWRLDTSDILISAGFSFSFHD